MKNINKRSTSIKNWAEDDQPYKKTMRYGISQLSIVEIISILIRSGTKNESALEVSRALMNLADNDLNKLSRLSIQEMRKIKGIGDAKAIMIAAALELGKRKNSSISINKTVIRSSLDITTYLRNAFQDLAYEIFAVVLLNRANVIIHFEIISRGGITGTVADPRIILKLAIDHKATSFIICHNHPSGNLQPSKADENITKSIAEISNLLDIKMLDHIIVSNEGYYSFADNGKL